MTQFDYLKGRLSIRLVTSSFCLSSHSILSQISIGVSGRVTILPWTTYGPMTHSPLLTRHNLVLSRELKEKRGKHIEKTLGDLPVLSNHTTFGVPPSSSHHVQRTILLPCLYFTWTLVTYCTYHLKGRNENYFTLWTILEV